MLGALLEGSFFTGTFLWRLTFVKFFFRDRLLLGDFFFIEGLMSGGLCRGAYIW